MMDHQIVWYKGCWFRCGDMQHSKEIPTDAWKIPQTLNHLWMKEILSYMYFGEPGVCSRGLLFFFFKNIHRKQMVQSSSCFFSLDVYHITGTKLPHPILPYLYSDSFKICVCSTSPTTLPRSKLSLATFPIDIQTPPQKVFGPQKQT